jgi:hypothetical protein
MVVDAIAECGDQCDLLVCVRFGFGQSAEYGVDGRASRHAVSKSIGTIRL